MQVLLTRPLCDSIETSKILNNFKVENLILPFLKIKNIEYNFLKCIYADTLIFTSKNAARFFKHNLKSFKKNPLIFSVGTETKRILSEKGFSKVINVDGDVNNLKKKIEPYLKNLKLIVHPTLADTNNELKLFFQKFNCNYVAIKCYETQPILVDKVKFKKFMIDSGNIITLYSSKTAKQFVKSIFKNKLESYCKNKIFITLSRNIANELEELECHSIKIAEKPNQESMIKLILDNYFLEIRND